MTKKSKNYNADAENNVKVYNTRREFFVKRWSEDLFLIEASKFEYLNLPVNLPAYEIEQRLILQGNTAIYRHPIYGLVTIYGAVNGVGIYNNGTGYTGAQPVLGDFDGKDGIDCVIGYNTSRDKSRRGFSVIRERLRYFSEILGDIDLSLSMIAEASRAMNTVGAKTDNAVNTLELWYKKLHDGEPYVPLLETGIFEEVIPIISKDCADARGMVNDLQSLKASYLKQFYNFNGVSYIAKKAERMITDEVEADEDMLSINIYDQLKCRGEMVEKVNALFDTNIKVRVNNLVIT